MVHVMKYLDPSEPHDAHATERELEGFLDFVQPGWANEVVVRRYLPSMTVSQVIPTVAAGALGGRVPVEVRGLQGLHLAGDWVGGQGMPANASVASASHAAHLVMARARSQVTGAVA